MRTKLGRRVLHLLLLIAMQFILVHSIAKTNKVCIVLFVKILVNILTALIFFFDAMVFVNKFLIDLRKFLHKTSA